LVGFDSFRGVFELKTKARRFSAGASVLRVATLEQVQNSFSKGNRLTKAILQVNTKQLEISQKGNKLVLCGDTFPTRPTKIPTVFFSNMETMVLRIVHIQLLRTA